MPGAPGRLGGLEHPLHPHQAPRPRAAGRSSALAERPLGQPGGRATPRRAASATARSPASMAASSSPRTNTPVGHHPEQRPGRAGGRSRPGMATVDVGPRQVLVADAPPRVLADADHDAQRAGRRRRPRPRRACASRRSSKLASSSAIHVASSRPAETARGRRRASSACTAVCAARTASAPGDGGELLAPELAQRLELAEAARPAATSIDLSTSTPSRPATSRSSMPLPAHTRSARSSTNGPANTESRSNSSCSTGVSRS